MKLITTKVLLLILLSLGSISGLWAQEGEKQMFPAENIVYDMDGKEHKMSDIYSKNNGNPVVIDFWATWCKPCLLSIKHMHEQYELWRKVTGVKIVLISIDDENLVDRIKHLAELKGWKFELYIDRSKSLMKDLNFNQIPQTYLVEESGEIVWHEEVPPGDEEKLYKEIKKSIKKKK